MQNNKLVNIASIKCERLTDGNGLRTVIFFQGCSHGCTGCQNPHTWDFNNENLVSIQYIQNIIKSDTLSTGVTFSGGCPMCQYHYMDAIIELAKEIKKNNLSLWCYCGEKFEDLHGKQLELLSYIDVLIDGLFDIDKRDDTLLFRGSSNQRIINVQESLKQNKVVLWED
jgi:anaerobic ribonucleoside-triphosphate reductase activating protein